MSRSQHEHGSGAIGELLRVRDLGSVPYQEAYETQCRARDEVLSWRDSSESSVGELLLVEHKPPVITVSKRAGASDHLVATPKMLEEEGVVVEQTDRGGDITYHGPGQLVVYPIVDLNRLGLNLHSYMRFLEAVVIETCAVFGVEAHRDHCATGVWVGGVDGSESCEGRDGGAKIAAIGVRVRKWVTMHGLALNVTTNLDHFKLIVPCGLVGRPVTSMKEQLGDACPTMQKIKDEMVRQFARRAVSCIESMVQSPS